MPNPSPLPPASENQAEIICIFGKRGSGKSTLAKRLVSKERRLIVVDPLLDYPELPHVDHPLDLLRHVRRRARFRVAYRPSSFKSAREAFPWVCKVASAARDCTLLVDEVSMYTTASWSPEGFEELIQYGRHHRVRMVCVSRRPTEVPKDLTGNAARIYVFLSHEPRDVTYFRQFIGPDAEKILSLPPFTPLVWTSSPAGTA